MKKAPWNSTTCWNLGVVLICVFLAAITWMAFGQTLTYEFINFDDPEYVVDNPAINKGLTLHGIAWVFTHRVSGNWHPLTMITHMLDCQFYGLKPGRHHFTNVLIHTAAVLLLFVILWKMTGARWPSAFVAALFAVHPLRAESVVWISERKDVLSGLFFMLTLAAYLRYVRKPSLASYLLVALVFVVGLMSKPMLVTLPFILLLLDYWPLNRDQKLEVRGQRSEVGVQKSEVRSQSSNIETGTFKAQNFRKLVLEKIPLLGLSLISCGITLLAQRNAISPMELMPIWLRTYTAVVSCIIYIRQMFWPVKLALLYPYPAGTLSGWVLVGSIGVLFVATYCIWRLRKRRPYLITGWFWYLIMLMPVIGLVQVGGQAHADRYTYLPQIGLYIAVTWTMIDLSVRWRYRHAILGTLALFVIAALISCARIQTSFWKNSESTWTRTLAVTSNNAVAHQSLGSLLLKNGRANEAISHLHEALKIWPDYRQGRINPDNVRVHDDLAAAFVKKGRLSDAITEYETAVRLRPDDADIQDKLASVFWQKGEIDKAIMCWNKTLAIRPNDPHVHTSLGTALVQKRLVDEAIAHYEKSLAIAPQSTVTLNNLALLLATCSDARFRNGARAIQLAEQADQLSGGNNPLVVRTLAAAYAEQMRFTKAIDAAERALKLANEQGNSALLNNLRFDIDLYRLNLPRRNAP